VVFVENLGSSSSILWKTLNFSRFDHLDKYELSVNVTVPKFFLLMDCAVYQHFWGSTLKRESCFLFSMTQFSKTIKPML